jgi:hypothetical protein
MITAFRGEGTAIRVRQSIQVLSRYKSNKYDTEAATLLGLVPLVLIF